MEPERTDNPVQKNHLNQILFLDKVGPFENLKESDFLKTMTFQEDKDFSIRVFLIILWLIIFISLMILCQLMNCLKREITNLASM